MTEGAEPTAAARRRAIVVAGHAGHEPAVRAGLDDPSSVVRRSALSALARMGALQARDVSAALDDPELQVRRRACELAGRMGAAGPLPGSGALVDKLVQALADVAPAVVEAACYALGEVGDGGRPAAIVAAVRAVAMGHGDPLCREAAVAALGALGQADGLGAVLSALQDKAAVRRRAVIALAGFDDAFEGGEVQDALRRAATDPDWQVRQGAEDVLGQRTRPGPRRPRPARPA